MLTTEEVKIKIPNDVTSEYIDTELKKMGLEVIHWAIINADEEFYTLNVSVEK